MTSPTLGGEPNTFEWHSLFAGDGRTAAGQRFPFERALSFAGIVEKWQRLAASDPAAYASSWAQIERDLREAPALSERIEDASVLERHADLIARLIRPLFPSSDWTNEAKVLSGPFGGLTVARTANYDRVLGAFAESALDVINQHDGYIRTLYAYKAILRRFFAADLRLEQPLVFVVPSQDSGLSRYFKIKANSRFVDVEATGELPRLRPEDIEELLGSGHDLSLWMRKLPPSHFRFVGVSVISLTDVTDETATASIAHSVLTSDANLTEDTFDVLEGEVRNLFGSGELRMGLASLQADGEMNVVSDRRIWNSLVIREALRRRALDWRNSLYGQALGNGQCVMVRDVDDAEIEQPLRELLLAMDVRSLFLQPLRYDDRIVGIFELTSPRPQAVDASTMLKVQRIEPVLALAVFQNLERFETRVESTIQQAYTAIHPSVQWRFREAAIEMLEMGAGSPEPVPVTFEDLHPLYGSADIRGSTRQRNEAARRDAIERLRAAQRALRTVRSEIPLTIIDEMESRVSSRIERYEASWSAADESGAARFLTGEVEPLLDAMIEGRDGLRPVIESYRLETRSRDDSRAAAYESGRRQINRLIIAALRREQAGLQKLFPHYFEHTETDGVEHSMYIGQSIAPTKVFDPAYVQNLRLRQLMVACEIAVGVDKLNQSLAHPLDITQLIVVQHATIALRFRTDEKRFDVDGPTGVRFEMLKKRLDKARVRRTDDRITQPGTVTVVYATDAEAAEYDRYADYLVAGGHVDPGPEVVDVEDLPGISGLKALRLRIRIDPTRPDTPKA